MIRAREKLLAYRNGYKARGAGVVVGDNPYPETSPLHWEWMVGWVDAAEKTTPGTRVAPGQTKGDE